MHFKLDRVSLLAVDPPPAQSVHKLQNLFLSASKKKGEKKRINYEAKTCLM